LHADFVGEFVFFNVGARNLEFFERWIFSAEFDRGELFAIA
jgi:hypothetical protein